MGVLPAVGDLPPWLLWGVLFGGLVSAAIAGVFYAGTRLFPTEYRDGTTGRGQRTRDGRSRRHIEIRQYLAAIDEQYLEGHTVEGREVAFYLPQRDVAITFDARAFYHIDRSATHAVLGVPATATPAEIQAAYRERVKEVHPDQGGDTAEFRRVREAYATATRDGP